MDGFSCWFSTTPAEAGPTLPAQGGLLLAAHCQCCCFLTQSPGFGQTP